MKLKIFFSSFPFSPLLSVINATFFILLCGLKNIFCFYYLFLKPVSILINAIIIYLLWSLTLTLSKREGIVQVLLLLTLVLFIYCVG